MLKKCFLKINRFLYPISIGVVVLLLLSANRVKIPYTPYECIVWELKANEGYRPNWYPDGWVRGRKAYSIGFGWNDQGKRRRHEIEKYTRDGKVTFDEALKITLMEIDKYGQLNKDPYKNAALRLYSYNCGPTSDGSRLGKCCGARWGCGNSNPEIRKSHNRRRKFELALWNHDVKTITEVCDRNREKIIHVILTLKSQGDL